MKLCVVDGCEKEKRSRGFCNAHYQKFKKYGDPLKKVKGPKPCVIDGCERRSVNKGLCNMHHKRKAKNGSPFIIRSKPIAMVDFKITEKGCFECISHKPNNMGYPIIQRNNKREPVHRFVYRECFGEIPDGMVIRHKCDNPLCMNPEHLELGTQHDNILDCVKRGRNDRGEKRYNAKLKEKDVVQIKKCLMNGVRVCELARKYSVGSTTISNIKSNRVWKHVKVEGWE